MSREMDALGLDSDADVQVGLYDSLGKYAMTNDFRYAKLKIHTGHHQPRPLSYSFSSPYFLSLAVSTI